MEFYDIDDLEHWHFEISEGPCNALLQLVLDGKKKATTSSLAGFEISEDKLPSEGDMSVITNWDEEEKCVIRTTNVRILPYKNVTEEMALLEGEDSSLESWRESHEKFFREDGKDCGYEFSEDMLVVFEEFEVVEVL